jgi:hypothetical protein
MEQASQPRVLCRKCRTNSHRRMPSKSDGTPSMRAASAGTFTEMAAQYCHRRNRSRPVKKPRPTGGLRRKGWSGQPARTAGEATRREEVLAGICYFFTQQESLDLSPEPKSFRTKTLLIDRDRLRHRLLDRRLDERPSHPWAGPNVSDRVTQCADCNARHKF